MTTLSPLQVAAYAKAAGWPQEKLPWVVAVSFAESSWQTDAVNENKNGTHDVGLMQVNSVHGYSDEDMKDPLKNMVAAKTVYASEGEQAWVSSDNPRRKQVAGQATMAASQVAGMSDPHNLLSAAGEVESPTLLDRLLWLKDPTKVGPGLSIGNNNEGSATALGEVAGNLFTGLGPALWIGGGAILVILGVVMLAKGEVSGVVGSVIKGVAK